MPKGAVTIQGDDALYPSRTPNDLTCAISPAQREGKPKGQVLQADTAKSPAAQLVAVFAMDRAPVLKVQADATMNVVTVKGQTLRFDRASGEVRRG